MKYLMLGAFFVSVLFAHGQSKLEYTSVEIFHGDMVANYPTFPATDEPIFILRTRMGKNLSGSEIWHRKYGYPKTGINIVVGSLGNASVLGHFGAAMFDFILSQRLSSKLFFEEGASLGAAYFTKKYDEQTNPKNIAIGSHVTAFVNASFNLVYKLNSKNDLLLGANIFHGSNSHTVIPNLGVNMPGVSIGYRYNFRSAARVTNVDSVLRYSRKPKLNVRFALGINEQGNSVNAVNGPKYPIYLAGIFISKKFSPINRVGSGIEVWYNAGVESYIQSHQSDFSDSRKAAWACQYTLSHEFLFSHFSLLTQGGIYLYNPFYKSEYKNFYNGNNKAFIKTIVTAKLGVQYYFKNVIKNNEAMLFIGTYVKTNFGQADFWENGIGFQF